MATDIKDISKYNGQDIPKQVWEDAEMFNKHLGEMKNIQSIINHAIIEMKSTLEGTNSRVTETEDKIREVEDRILN